jgi:hypothetical protein
MRILSLRTLLLHGMLLAAALPAAAQNERGYVGVVAGFSILSADGRSVTTPDRSSVSLYDPGNGPAINAFGGFVVSDWVSVQANYIWNRNRLTLTATHALETGSQFYEQERTSSHHSAFGDVLVYFRARGQRIRPYLSTGVGLVGFESRETRTRVRTGGIAVPPAVFSDTTLVVRSAVGIDVRVGENWAVRYSFSEFIGPNPISDRIDPPGERVLMNFQNLVGVVRTF